MLPLDAESVQRATDASPASLAPLRQRGWEHFGKLSMPSEREEVWRYVDLDFDMHDFGLPVAPGAEMPTPEAGVLPQLEGVDGRAIIVDGFVGAAQSGVAQVTALRNVDDAAWLGDVYGSLLPVDLDKFAAAHAAFGVDGVVVRIPRNAAATTPAYVDVQAVTPGGATFPKVLVAADEGSEASVVLNYRSPPDARTLVVPQLEIMVGSNATLRISIVQHWGDETIGIAQGRATLGRDASLQLAEAGLGGRLARFHLTVDLEGRGSNAQLLGAYFGEREQILDYRYFMHHAGLNTSSEMFLKGAVEDTALSVFTGMIRIDEGAQRTDAFQTNRNLILSEGAAAQSVPNLEILANDVRCGHGSTVGPLDDEQRYYLMSRGLDRAQADRLQVRGFFEEALRRFPEPAVAEPVRRWINRKFVAAQEEGRV